MNKIFLAILFSLSLSACGGGGGGAPAPVAAPIVVDEDANGLWQGTFSQDGVGSFELFGLFYEGQIVARSYAGGTLYIGNYTVSQDNLSGSAIVRSFGGADPSTRLGTANFQGVVVERSQISLTYTTTYGPTGSISVFYENIYDRDSSLSLIAGTYQDGNVFTINPDGSFTIPNNAPGCAFTGMVSLLSSNYNLYQIDGSSSGCTDPAQDGIYSGYATLLDSTGVNDQLVLWFENDAERGFFNEWFRI